MADLRVVDGTLGHLGLSEYPQPKDAWLSIRRACIRLLERYADDENTRVDLRKLWRGHSGS